MAKNSFVEELTVKPCYCPSGATARYPMQVYLCHNKVGLLNFKKCMKIWKSIVVPSMLRLLYKQNQKESHNHISY